MMPNTSQRDSAYEALKHRIITLVYRPGSYLNESMIGEDLEFGKTPIRQAIDRLRLEGMLDVMPRKGVIVRPISFEEVSQIASVRIVLEGYCVEQAAEKISADDLDTLLDVINQTKEVALKQDSIGLMSLDREFHHLVSTASNNQVLVPLITGLLERSLRFWFISLSKPEHVAKTIDEHFEIYEALKKRDPARAKAAAEHHIRSFLKSISSDV